MCVGVVAYACTFRGATALDVGRCDSWVNYGRDPGRGRGRAKIRLAQGRAAEGAHADRARAHAAARALRAGQPAAGSGAELGPEAGAIAILLENRS